MSDEIEKWKARLFDLEKETEYANNQLFAAIGKEVGYKEGYAEAQKMMDAKIKEAVMKALATGEKVEPRP